MPFSPRFKLEAIEQVVKYQQSAAEVAQALQLAPSQLRKWRRQYKEEVSGVTPEIPRGHQSSVNSSRSGRRLNGWKGKKKY